MRVRMSFTPYLWGDADDDYLKTCHADCDYLNTGTLPTGTDYDTADGGNGSDDCGLDVEDPYNLEPCNEDCDYGYLL